MKTKTKPKTKAKTVKPKMPKRALYWHVHHEILAEWCNSYRGRVLYIKHIKAKEETYKKIAHRLKLMRPIRLRNAPAWLKRVAHTFENGTGDQSWASRAWCHVPTVSARRELEALHRKQCKNCTWDGQTIFSREFYDRPHRNG